MDDSAIKLGCCDLCGLNALERISEQALSSSLEGWTT